MTEYILPSQLDIISQWESLMPKKEKTLVFSPRYNEFLLDEAMMAISFEYYPPLFEKIISVSLPSEMKGVLDVLNSNHISVSVENGNITIRGT